MQLGRGICRWDEDIVIDLVMVINNGTVKQYQQDLLHLYSVRLELDPAFRKNLSSYWFSRPGAPRRAHIIIAIKPAHKLEPVLVY